MSTEVLWTSFTAFCVELQHTSVGETNLVWCWTNVSVEHLKLA
jgi:hypothetical protein